MKSGKPLTFRGSLITKLIVVCAVILFFVGAIVAANFVSFRNIQHVLSTIIDRDVAQVVENARLGREISQVFAETNLLISSFIDHPEFLRSEGERLLSVLQRNMTSSATGNAEQIYDVLQEFSRRLQALLDQCAAVNDISQAIEILHGEISAELMSLEETAAARTIAMVMEDNDEEIFAAEQISIAIPGYRDTLSQIAILLMTTKRDYLTERELVHGSTEQKHFLTLLEEFETDLDIVMKSGEDFAASGELLRDAILQYGKSIGIFSQEMEVFQEHVTQLNSAREQLLSELKTIDSQVVQSVSSIKEEASGAIRASRNLVVYLSIIIFAILIALAYYIIREIEPIKNLSRTASLLAEGNIAAQSLPPGSHDEIGILSQAFKNLMRYLQGLAMSATEIARGSLSEDIQPRSKHDVLGNAFREMSLYLNDMARVAGAVAEGDLTATAQLRSDEDAFGKTICTMTEGLHNLILQIRSCAEEIALTGGNIKALSTGDIEIVKDVNNLMSNAVSTMTGMEESVNNAVISMETLSSAVKQTSASVSQTAISIASIALSANNLNNRTNQMEKSLKETTSSVQKVVESTDLSQELTQKTIQDALEGQQAVEQVFNSMQTIQATVMTAVDAMGRFESRSHEIDTVLEVIREITEQTSLLALNASIIAAQAGAHGRGFAVVADEIRNLAQGVGASTKNIAAIVTTIQQETAEVAQTIHTGADDVEQGMKRSKQARDTLEKILNSTQHSSSVVTEMSEVLHDLANDTDNLLHEMEQVSIMTREIRQATSEHQSSTGQIRQAIEHINDKALEIRSASEQQSSGLSQVLDEARDVAELVGQNLESSQHIAQTTEVLASQSDILLRSVDRFRLKH